MKKVYKYGKRGFAGMDKEKHREIASRGGKAAQEMGVGHRWNSAEAQAAGRKSSKNLKK